MEGCARSRAADLASPTTVSPWPFLLRCMFLFSFLFFFSPLGAAGSVKSKLAWPDRASSTRFLHPCEISSVISELQSAGLASLFSLPTLHQCRFVLPLGRGRQQEGGPCVKSERTSHLTPSPDLSQVALGGQRGARPKPRRTMQLSETLAATGLAAESSFSFSKRRFGSFLCGLLCLIDRLCRSHKKTARLLDDS